MSIFEYFKNRKRIKQELNELEVRNAKRKADLKAAMFVAAVSEDSAVLPEIKSKYSKFMARVEAIYNRTELLDEAITDKDIGTARVLDNIINKAINNLDEEPANIIIER